VTTEVLSVFCADPFELVDRTVEVEWELVDGDKLVVNDERESMDDALLVVVLSESGTTETLLEREFAT
jgi:hypothetical protein